MGSLFGDWPSFDPHNFSQLRPSDPANPSKITPATYHPTHNRTVPPPNQGFEKSKITSVEVISTEATNILLRQFYQQAEEKLRPKRAAAEHLTPEHGCKQPKGSFADTSNSLP
ncbi:hypothetical protein HHK36_029033 [Tetracentron sinense]|uniref:DET1- and DDB1-associated protein 1 domain-containing protein n=1 Tax=Tetracentron sinense TaxID=13715 RepID=A0A834YGX0_TETSI|nr:hypothetical protein HHK36_029033 [Tetracentron sinense]